MIKSIKLKDARDLIYQNKGKFVYVDCVRDPNYYEGNVDSYVKIIFKEKEYSQLYSFWYYISDVPDLGTTIDTIQQFDAFLNVSDNDNLDIGVAPVKKVKVTVTKYVEEDYND